MEEIIKSHFDSKNFLIEQLKMSDGDRYISIYNPLSPNTNENKDIQPYERCLHLGLNKKDKSINLLYLSKCGIDNGGRHFLAKVIDFAKKYGYKKIFLEDDSTLYFYVKDTNGNITQEIGIDLAKFKYLKEGISWYGKLGFINFIYERDKERIFKFIGYPLDKVLELLKSSYKKYAKDDGFEINELEELVYNFYEKMYNILGENDFKSYSVSDLFTSFEKYLKNIKNNEIFEEDVELQEIVLYIGKLTDLFYEVMINTEYIGNLLYEQKPSYFIYEITK